MNEAAPQPNTEIAPSVAALLEVFHEQTSEKLAIAPVDSVALCHLTTGIVEVDEDGWCTDYDDLDEQDGIDGLPIGVEGRETP
ncbi:hypothetical protein ACQP2U_14695 [Nocardia sp. CA-084685]|uniref:hypothetical protein n=1 Tax=Nocardia sp. CA-084685 TaxID=3239970 RepID=UPI003D994429